MDDQATLVVDSDGILINVLANDHDPDDDPLEIIQFGQPAHGTVNQQGGGTLRYVPNANFTGSDSFIHTISDGRGGTATAMVTITVLPSPGGNNQPPVAVNDTAATAAGQPVVIDVLANDSDPDGDALTIISVTSPSYGTVQINGGLAVTYTSAVGVAGTDSFTYTISDGRGGTATATVTVTLSSGPGVGMVEPTAVDDQYNYQIGAPSMVLHVLDNDILPPGATEWWITVVGVPQYGTAVVNSDNTITYSLTARWT